MNKEKIIKAIQEDKAIIRHDPYWKYPQQRDDQRSCPMLDFMFKIEYKSGTLIFIPDENLER